MDFLQIILTTVLSAAVLFTMAKIAGHKQVAQLDFFDYISGISIGSIAAELATELEDPWKPLTALVVYGIIAEALRVLTTKRQKSRKYVNGTPTIIMDRGKLYRENMKKAKLDLSEFMLMCRQAGYFNLNNKIMRMTVKPQVNTQENMQDIDSVPLPWYTNGEREAKRYVKIYTAVFRYEYDTYPGGRDRGEDRQDHKLPLF